MPSVSRRRLAAFAAIAVLLIATATVALQRGGEDEPGGGTPVPAATGTTPAPGFTTDRCRTARPAEGSVLGLGVPRPARLAAAGTERDAFAGALACLQMITGATPMLRTQLPIDVTRRTAPGGDEFAELRAFAALLTEHQAAGIVSVRAHDFTRCRRPGAAGTRPVARRRTALDPGEALRPCDYPSPELYRALFTELHAALIEAAPEAELRFTAWNEPDHPDFTLHALGENTAARIAGRYWAQAAAVAGPERVLAGEFADRSIGRLLRLRDRFLEGAAPAVPAAWALHPYRDLTAPAEQHVLDRFEAAVAPAPVWMTEVTPRLSGRGGLSGRGDLQAAAGGALRARLEARPTRAMLYLLLPPDGSGPDQWDSALADRSGRARPFVCGLAGISPDACAGDPAAYGG